ncbi:GNAT family N-acetyltransferase [Cyanobacterium stanieri LEGE 03274]|uniref:GNAT family N-acetyltransferase n=1 Tax=Cyanobacterium stanieri LEGE 03274 TaxID=1828756 RepID=A0ABR9V2K8_9CHRO|nr:GNAT family N-acetyltransferase [Cyanobacterium stanieri]MBE9221784.1 GNAT family N-acetyltransferase [Cyanobacterium stanieri LEGE 03274]
MNTSTLPKSSLKIRGVQYRDLSAIASLLQERLSLENNYRFASLLEQVQKYQSCYGLLQFSQMLPSSWNRDFYVYVAEKDGQIQGLIQVAPFNQNRSTWKVELVIINHNTSLSHLLIGNCSIGSQLLRYCFEKIWEARTWILEVNINEKSTLGLYRENGFSPLAQITNWQCDGEVLAKLAQKEPSLPNLLPVSNADSRLLYQLDCVSLPPTIRQVFDLHLEDFKTSFLAYVSQAIKSFWSKEETIKAYVFEPQRKAAIGYFQLTLSQNGAKPHEANLTVHPAYTWLYPKLLTQMASVIERFPSQCLLVSSGDYQPEREEYLEKIGATRVEQNLLMSRSVWHKLRESKPLESLNLQEVLQGLKPSRPAIPTHWQPSPIENPIYPSSPLHHQSDEQKKGEK